MIESYSDVVQPTRKTFARHEKDFKKRVLRQIFQDVIKPELEAEVLERNMKFDCSVQIEEEDISSSVTASEDRISTQSQNLSTGSDSGNLSKHEDTETVKIDSFWKKVNCEPEKNRGSQGKSVQGYHDWRMIDKPFQIGKIKTWTRWANYGFIHCLDDGNDYWENLVEFWGFWASLRGFLEAKSKNPLKRSLLIFSTFPTWIKKCT